MTAEPAIAGREHWTSKGGVRLFLWEVQHILHSFLSQPAPVYRGE